MREAGHHQNFISLEGIDFTWKSAFAEWLERDLSTQGKKVLITRDPPYYLSPWDEFQEYFERGVKITKLSEAFLLLSARLDNYERVISPAVIGGSVVIADRYTDSWLAYQSIRQAPYFRGEQQAMEFLVALQDRLVQDRLLGLPALTMWISEDPEVAMSRAATVDKISKYENLPLQIQVDQQYQYLAKRFSSRIRSVDVRGLDIHAAYPQVWDIVIEHLSI